MRRLHRTVLHVAVLLLLGAAPAFAAWSLVWSDDFDGSSLNTADWTVDIGDGCPDLCGWGNNELEYYHPDNVDVADGDLILTARDQSYGGRAFTSGKVHTRDKLSFLYGRIEARIKLPAGQGLWPAFWMMPQDDAYGGWAASGEIDIMESANAMTQIGGTIHYGGSWPHNTYSGGHINSGTSYADDYHVYAVEWEPDEIRWYVDETLYATRTSDQWWSSGDETNTRAPFDQDFYIILNLAVGGWYPGCTDPGCITAGLPQEMRIDYVRVYEDIQNLVPEVAVTSPAPGATVPAGDVLIEATASDADGSVERVEFFLEGDLLGEDATAPFTLLWTGATDGCYRIKARAYDDLGSFGESSADVTVGAGCGQAPYGGTAPVLPAVIQAEDYDIGGEGVAYHDTDVANNGGAYRLDEAVDIEFCQDAGGGYDLGWLPVGEWVEYTIHAPVAAEYSIETRVACQSGGGAFRLEFDGVDRTGEVPVPVTTGWQTWTSVHCSADLPAGTQVMRLVPTDDGFNVNSFEFSADLTDVPPPVAASARLLGNHPNPFNPSTTIRYELDAPATVDLSVYDVSGRRLRELIATQARDAGRHTVLWDGRDDGGRIAPAGVYTVRLRAGGAASARPVNLVK